MQHVFIIGSKGIPANYGGFETFVDDLVSNQKNKNIKYHVACMNAKYEEFEYKTAHCFSIKVPNIGPAKAVYYDIKAFQYCIDYIKNNSCEKPIVYVLACRIGPFIARLKKKLTKYGGRLFVNPDGHEWLRAKWNAVIKKYWKYSEKTMVKNADLLICDSVNIEKYIQKEYKKYNPNTTYIAYGANVVETDGEDDIYKDWCKEKGIKSWQYYLVVGRFVPENNYELIIREFMNSNTTKDLVIITNVEKNKFYDKLKKQTGFDTDKRIKFVGTVYDKKLLNQIRMNASAYIHGHSVGGTNPSLLEALATTQVNILYDVGFNREVAGETALYFTARDKNLDNIILVVDKMSEDKRIEIEKKAKEIIVKNYSQEIIVDKYEKLVCSY